MPAFTYIGSHGETIVGMEPRDLTADDYDALDYDHQQAVYLNRGSDGGPLYVEVHEPAAAGEAAEADPATPAATEPAAVAEATPEPEPAAPEPEPAPPAEPDLNLPLDEPAPAEGAN